MHSFNLGAPEERTEYNLNFEHCLILKIKDIWIFAMKIFYNICEKHMPNMVCLPPTRSEERGVFGVVSIPVAILPPCHDMKMISSYLQET